jgi:chromosome segregation ATPase
MADCTPLPSPRVNSSRRRKSSRARRSNENAAPPSANLPTTPINRFGFKKRANASASQMLSAQEEEPFYEPVPTAPVELVSMLEGALGDLDAYAAIIRTRPVANQYDFKARISEMTDMHKQTKDALKDLVRRGRGLPLLLTTAQEEVNARLEAMAQELGTTRASHAHVKRELSSARTHGDDLSLASQQLQADLLAARAALEALQPQCDLEAGRADAAETKLRLCERDLERATALAAATETARAELAAAAERARAEHDAAAAEAARQLAEHSAARAEREAELSAELAELRGEAQGTQESLEGALDESRARMAELDASMAKLTAEHAAVSAAHASLKTSSAATAQTLAEKEGTLIRVQTELEAVSSQMEKKEADLRASIQSVMQIQKDNTEQAQSERQRFDKLEGELRTLRDNVQRLQLEKQSALLDGERLQTEIASLNARIQEMGATVHRVEGERDMQLARVAEMTATIAVERSTTQKIAQVMAGSLLGGCILCYRICRRPAPTSPSSPHLTAPHPPKLSLRSWPRRARTCRASGRRSRASRSSSPRLRRRSTR